MRRLLRPSRYIIGLRQGRSLFRVNHSSASRSLGVSLTLRPELHRQKEEHPHPHTASPHITPDVLVSQWSGLLLKGAWGRGGHHTTSDGEARTQAQAASLRPTAGERARRPRPTQPAAPGLVGDARCPPAHVRRLLSLPPTPVPPHLHRSCTQWAASGLHRRS